MLVSYAYKYASLFLRGGVISFTYNKNHEGLDIDPSGTPQFMVPASENTSSYETKKALRNKNKTVLFYLKSPCILLCLITFSDVRCQLKTCD